MGGKDESALFSLKQDNTTKTRFSMKSPVEETDKLLALHNLTEKNLTDALKLGGLPMPSIAVVKAEAGHSKYGLISLVFDKLTALKKSTAWAKQGSP